MSTGSRRWWQFGVVPGWRGYGFACLKSLARQVTAWPVKELEMGSTRKLAFSHGPSSLPQETDCNSTSPCFSPPCCLMSTSIMEEKRTKREKEGTNKRGEKEKVNEQDRVKAHFPHRGFKAWDIWKLM